MMEALDIFGNTTDLTKNTTTSKCKALHGCKRAALSSVAFAAICLWSGTTQAQTTRPPVASGDQQLPTGTTSQIEASLPGNDASSDIVVTARKTNERLRDVPIAVTAATSAELAKKGVTSAVDFSKIDASFSFQQSDSGTPVFSIRGIGFLNNTVAASPTASAYVDQVPLPYTLNTKGAILDLDRVEVLKGPQGTLFGQNSTGGAINFIAAKPTSSLQSGGQLTYARFNEIDAEAYVSGPISSTLKARIAARTEQRLDGYQYTYLPGDNRRNGKKDFTTGRLLIDWSPSADFNLEFSASGWRDRSDTPGQQYLGYVPNLVPGAPLQAEILPTYPLAPRNNRATEYDLGLSLRNNENQYQVAVRADWDVSPELQLTSITSYLHLDVNQPIDADGTSFPDIAYVLDSTVKSFSQELRLASSYGGRFTWVIGGNYQYDNVPESDVFTADQSSTTMIGPFNFSTQRLQNNQRVSTAAAFANGEYKLTDALSVQAAARYTDQKRDFRGCFFDSGDGTLGQAFGFLATILSNSPVTIGPGQCATLDASGKPVSIVARSLNENNVSWKGGVSWKPDTATLLYASITKGYKAGAFGTLPAIRESQFTPVVQESLVSYELGTKLTVLDRILDVDSSAFYYDYDNKQIQGFVQTGFPFGNLPALISVPKSRVIGIELNSTLRPIKGVRMTFGATYLNSRVTRSFVTPSPVGDEVDIKGESFPNAPRWQLIGDAEYDFRLSDRYNGYVGANASYRTASQAQFGEDPRFTIPAYALLDLRVGVTTSDGAWGLQVFGRNVTNHLYPVTITRVIDTITQTVGMPATYGLTVSHKFR